MSDKSHGGYCGNTHPFSEIKLPPSQRRQLGIAFKVLGSGSEEKEP